jgi:uncharacterized membrane protein
MVDKWLWSKRRLLVFSGIVFVILGAYKTLQHITFNTYAYDLGIRSSILYNIAFGGRVWDSLHSLHGFSGHFHPVSFVLAGLYRIWPNALLLCLLQALAVALGLFLLIKLLEGWVKDRRKHLVIIALFLANPFLHHALCFDFHPEIFAIPLVLLFFYLFKTNRAWWALLPGFALLTLKEDMGLVLLALGIYALVKRRWVLGSVMAVIGLMWLPLVLFWILPVFRSPGQSELISAHYASLGSSAAEIIGSILRRPWLLITQTFGQPQKLLTVALLVASVGAFALTRWETALILPLLLAHLLSDGEHQSSLTYQYSAGILPLLFFASIKGIRRINAPVIWILAGLAIPALVLRFPNPFKLGINLNRSLQTHRLIERIPADACISVSNNLAPHLVNRKDVVLYPRIEDADYVLIDLEGNIYPAEWETRYEDACRLATGYDTLAAQDGLLLLKHERLKESPPD